MDREEQRQPMQLHSSDPPAGRTATANGHGVKVPMAYEPMEVELEAPEPPPHNASADLHWAEEHLAPLQAAGLAEAAGRTGLGIMRVSSTPPRHSNLHQLHTSNAPALKPRPQKGDKQWPAVAQSSAPAAAPVAPLISYSAALKKSNPLLSAAVQAAVDSGSADAALPYADDLPPERFAGNIEYKWKLIAKSADRLVHLTTQLAYRLSEGAGECLYELGVQDDGFAQGLAAHELDQSIQCVLDMARSLGAEGTVIQRAWGREGLVAEVRVRRVGEVGVGVGIGIGAAGADSAADPLAHGNGLEARSNAHDRMAEHSAVALSSPPSSSGALPSPSSGSGGSGAAPSSSPSIQSTSCPCVSSGSSAAASGALYPSSCDLRLALVGGSFGGKSSLLGVLVSNQRDDGRGRARLHVVRHRHEVERGRSSAIARQVIGFDARGQIINYTLHHTQTLGSAAVPPPSAASFLASPGSAPILSPSPSSLPEQTPDAASGGKKKDKGISALFGGGDSSDDDEDDESDSSDDDAASICDFGFECAPEPSLAPLCGDGVGVGGAGSFVLSSGGEELDGASSGGAVCSSSDWHRIMDKSHKVYTIFDIPSTLTNRLIGTSCPDYCCIVVSCNNDNPAENAATAPQSQDAATVPPAVVPSGAASSPASSPALISSLTREQVLICAALHIPFLLLLCKADLAGPQRRAQIVQELHELCAQIVSSVPSGGGGGSETDAPAGARVVSHKIPVLLSPVGADLAGEAAAEAARHLDACMELLERNQTAGLGEADVPEVLRSGIVRAAASVPAASATSRAEEKTGAAPLWFPQHTFAPLLLLSNVTGEGMALFKRCLFRLHNYRREFWDSRIRRPIPAPAQATSSLAAPSDLAPASTSWEAVGAEFSIDEIFTVDCVGSVVSGTILAGVIHEGDTLLLGPLPDAALASASVAGAGAGTSAGVLPLPPLPASWSSWGCPSSFRPVVVKSLHLSRKSFKNARAGQSATLALKKIDRAWLRRGMVLLAVPRGALPMGVPRSMPAVPQPQPLAPPERSAWPRCCVGFEALIRLLDPSSSDAPCRSLREAQTGGGSASGSSLSRRRAQAAQISAGANGNGNGIGGVNATVGSVASGGRSSPLSSSHAISLRGQPIIHVGTVRQGGEVVALRPVRLQSAASLRRVQAWMEGMRALVASRDVDEPHPPGRGLAALIDTLEREEAQAEADAAAAAANPAHSGVSLQPVVEPAPAASSSYALVRFEFLYQAEYLRLGRPVLFRDDRARGTGLITDLCFVDEEEEPAGPPAQSASEPADTGSAAALQLPARNRSPPQQQQPLREREQSDSKTPSPSNGSGRKRVSSPPLQSPSPLVVLSAFARSKERRALARKAEAAAAAAAAAGPSVASLPHSQSHWTLPQSHSQSQRASICGGVGAAASPLVGPRAHPAVSLGCTPLLSATPWPNAPALTDELQLNSDDAQSLVVHVDARE